MSTRIKLHISQQPVRDDPFRAHLAHTDDIPLLLGFSGLLDRADVHFSVKRGEAYLEI